MSTPHYYSQRPMICEAMADGTGRWRCAPEPYNTPTWFLVIFGVVVIGIVGVIAKTLIGEWWAARQWKKKRLEQQNRER
jgi:hypothetical protein